MPVAEKTDKYGRHIMDIESILFQQNRTVFIDDVITDALAAGVIRQLLYLATVSNEDITLVINSPGGSVTAGLAIYDAMVGIPCDVSTLCMGMAASMAVVLWMTRAPWLPFWLPWRSPMRSSRNPSARCI